MRKIFSCYFGTEISSIQWVQYSQLRNIVLGNKENKLLKIWLLSVTFYLVQFYYQLMHLFN